MVEIDAMIELSAISHFVCNTVSAINSNLEGMVKLQGYVQSNKDGIEILAILMSFPSVH